MWFVAYGYAEEIVLQVASKYIEAYMIYLQIWNVTVIIVQNLNVKCMVPSVSVAVTVSTVVVRRKAKIPLWVITLIWMTKYMEDANVMKR